MTVAFYWRAPARLLLRDAFMAQDPVELDRGDLAEMIASALEQRQAERERLVITCEGSEDALRWPQIATLAARTDFPTFI